MIKAVLFAIFISCLFLNAYSQTQDSSYSTDSDSLIQKVVSDTLSVLPARIFIPGDLFRDEVSNHFSLGGEITSREIDNSFGENAGDLIQMKSLLDVIKFGSSGQPVNVYLAGDGRGMNAFVDGNSYKRQDLDFPQRGEMDLNTISPSHISKIEFLPAGLANLWGEGTGVMGVNIITKDFDGIEPYSRLMENRGPYGFHRTEMELGRKLTSRGKFYVTTEFNQSDGYLINSDYDGMSLSGKTTFHLKKQMDIQLSAYQYKTDMGLYLFPEARFEDTRKKVNNWSIAGALLLQENESSFLNLSLCYDKQNQEVKSRSYNFESKKIDKVFALKATQTQIFKDRHNFKIEGRVERKNLKALSMEQTSDKGYVSLADMIRMSPKLGILLFSKINKEEGLNAGISFTGGVAYQITNDVNLFSTGGRFVGDPTLMDRFWLPFTVSFKDTLTDYKEEGDRGLKSQKSYSADFGVIMHKGNYKMSAYLFGSEIDDYIFWSNVDTTIYYGHHKPINSQARIWGANLDLSGKFLEHLTSYISYSFKRGENSNRNTRLPYSPDHNLFGYIQFENEYLKREIGLKLRLETNVISKRFLDEYEKDKEPAVATLNGKVSVRFLDFHFYYAVRNITNQVYRLSGDNYMPQRTFWWGFYWEFFD